MNKTLVFGAATAAVIVAAGAFACTATESIEALYGPPPEMDSRSDADDVVSVDVEQDDPIEDLYGPPVDDEVVVPDATPAPTE